MARAQRPALALAVAAVLGVAAAGVATAAPAGDWAKAPDPEPSPTAQVLAAVGASGESGFGRLVPGRSRLLVTFSERLDRAGARERLDGLGRVVPVLPEAGVWALEPLQPLLARDRVLERAGVAGAEWSLAKAIDDRVRPEPPRALGAVQRPTDTFFRPELQWGLLRGPAWSPDLTGIAPRPRVAILDSGVDPTHEEWAGSGTLVAPRSTVRDSADASDWGLTGHGTHVAGIAAAPVNGVGVVGVAPARAETAEIVPVQIADRRGVSTDETIIRGIRWSVLRGAKVISISSGGAGFSRAFQDTILWATKRGALVVASVGNEGDTLNTLNYPAAYGRVVGVGALCDEQRSRDCPTPYGVARFSNFNRSVDILAPGVNVLSTVPVGIRERALAEGYALKDGTSMAAPYVAGVAALVQANNGNALSPYQLARQLANTATDMGPRGYDIRTGDGAVNPLAAVTRRGPADDPDEVNDDIKWLDSRSQAKERDRRQVIEARVDRFDDPEDVYPVILRRGETVRVELTQRTGDLDLYLWRAGTRTVATTGGNADRNLVRFDGRIGRKVVAYRAQRTGRHYVNVYANSGRGQYTLRVTRSAG